MKNTGLLATLLLCGTFLTLPNAWCLDVAKDIRPGQTLTQQQKDELNAQAMKDLKSFKNQIEQQEKESDKKAIKYEKGIAFTKGAITEKDQKVVDDLTEGALVTPNIFRTESGALKYVKILLKGDHNSFRYFRTMKTEVERKTGYDEAMESALSWLKPKKKEEFNVIVEILKTKRDYPKTVAEAALLISFTKDRSVLPFLLELTKHPDARVRCATASSLYDLGDAETAMPIFKELIDTDASIDAMHALIDWRTGNTIRLKDERGYSILVNALNNKIISTRVEAAKLLYKSKRIPKEKAKLIAINTLSSYKPMKSYGVMFDPNKEFRTIIMVPGSGVKDLEKASREWNMDQRAYHGAIFLLRDLKDKETIPVLQKFAKQTDDSLHAKDAMKVIDYINVK